MPLKGYIEVIIAYDKRKVATYHMTLNLPEGAKHTRYFPPAGCFYLRPPRICRYEKIPVSVTKPLAANGTYNLVLIMSFYQGIAALWRMCSRKACDNRTSWRCAPRGQLIFLRCVSSSKQTRAKKHADVLIIGGAAMGSSAAYFIKSKSPETNVVVIERDSKVIIS